jgi:hypothetical protein
MCHRENTPYRDGDRISYLAPHLVYQPPKPQQPKRIEELKDAVDCPKRRVIPAKFMRQRILQQSDHLPVDIIDRSSGKQQGADRPPVPADSGITHGKKN